MLSSWSTVLIGKIHFPLSVMRKNTKRIKKTIYSVQINADKLLRKKNERKSVGNNYRYDNESLQICADLIDFLLARNEMLKRNIRIAIKTTNARVL